MKKKKVVLFYPISEKENIYKNFPIAFIKLGSQLLREGFEVELIDSRIEVEYEAHLIKALQDALFLGVSVMTGYPILHALKASRISKKANKELPVVWGGWHPSLLPAQTILNEDIDVVVTGQGERAIVELAKAIQSNASLSSIKGIYYKNRNGAVMENGHRPFEDVNNFAPVDFSLVDTSLYANATDLGRRSVFWVTSQGCPYGCGFCCTHGLYRQRWSGLVADRVLAEVEILVNGMGVDGISFTEDNFMVEYKRVIAFCEGLLRMKIKINWAMDARVDQVLHLTEQDLNLLRNSGCRKVFLGVESGDQEVLDHIDKKITVEQTYEAAKRLHDYGIIAEIFLMVGFPWNPRRDLQKTLRMIQEIKSKYPNHQSTPFLYTPFPKTKLYEIAVQNGLKEPASLEEWINWSVLKVMTPWVDRKYLNTVNMLVKYYIPMAYPSEMLNRMFSRRVVGPILKILHKLALARMKKNFFRLSIEWYVVNFFYYNIKVKFNLFKGLRPPR